MQIAKVVGRLSLIKAHPTLKGMRWALSVPQDLAALANDTNDRLSDAEEAVAVDELGVREGDLIGISDGAEAAAPFHPVPTPVDSYVCCILDSIEIDPKQASKFFRTKK